MHRVLVVVLVLAACTSAEARTLCDEVPPSLLEPFVGNAAAEAYSIERYSECQWRSGTAAVVVSREAVPDAALYIAHSIEGTSGGEVRRVQAGDEAVWFLDEALVARVGDEIVMVRAESIDLGDLLPVLKAVAAATEHQG